MRAAQFHFAPADSPLFFAQLGWREAEFHSTWQEGRRLRRTHRNMLPLADYNHLVLADSDIQVPQDYLAQVTGPLHDPNVGIVTCAYTGQPEQSLWSRLGALFINEWFIPSARVAALFGSRQFAFGATIALRRDTRISVGSFAAIVDQLADDYRLGELTRKSGLRTVLSECVVQTRVNEPTLAVMMHHELRWLRTIRAVRPLGYAFAFASFSVPVTLFTAALTAFSKLSLVLLEIALLARVLLRLETYSGATFVTRSPAMAPSKPSAEPAGYALMMKTLFLQAPSFEGFDGGAGSRCQAKREIRSFWYPTWLAPPAALIPGSRLVDAPTDGLTVEEVLQIARVYDLIILHTSTASFPTDARMAELLKQQQPNTLIGMVGPKVAVDPTGSLSASTEVDFVTHEDFDYTRRDIPEGRPLATIAGLSYRDPAGSIQHNPRREPIEDMDALPWVSPVYKDRLRIENYFIGYLKHPYVSFYTGRGCRFKCTFCLWPQTVGGHRYRVRSPASVIEEVAWIQKNLPEVKEIFFDDDTFTDLRPAQKRSHAAWAAWV